MPFLVRVYECVRAVQDRRQSPCLLGVSEKRVHLIPRTWSFVFCHLPHHPVYGQVEEQRRHTTTLSHTGLHIEADLVASYLAGEVVVDALNDEEDFLRYSYALRIRHRLSRWMLSNAFSRSTKLMYSCLCLCHSVHCSLFSAG